jgi:phenylacetate-CoA oxygenase PaaJ subunit
VISVVDLGIVRDVAWEGDTLVVTVTPTYSGCPATAVISMDIEAALRARGIEKLRLETRIAPPWTTDWLSEKGRARLEEFGIAPPQSRRRARALPPLRRDRPRADQPVRLHPLQGAVALPRLPGTLRLFQVHLR